MEDKEGPMPGPGDRVKRDEAPEGNHVAPRTENPTTYAGPTMQATAAAPATGSVMKKKRGRPRKYAADGSLAMTLSPMPISSSIPLSGEFPPWKQGMGRSVDAVKKSHKYDSQSTPAPGDGVSYIVGANFTPHVITVNAGEDVTMKVMSCSQQGARAICILSANGTISNVTLRQPTSSGGTLTHEGRFEILSLSGSFMPVENNGPKSSSGGMSVSLAGPDGRVLGGGLAGLLVAAGPVQVIVGSFLPGHQQEQKHKKQTMESAATVVSPTVVHTIYSEEIKLSFGGVKPIPTSPSFHGDGKGSGTLNPFHFRTSAIDNKSSSAREESNGHSLSQCEVSS
ncbi:hypothetical protein PTKIN_Ptkin05aG0144700 [Pterospermum kingtungense]